MCEIISIQKPYVLAIGLPDGIVPGKGDATILLKAEGPNSFVLQGLQYFPPEEASSRRTNLISFNV
jgi:hypothetical protein